MRQRQHEALTFDLFEQTAQRTFTRKDEGAIRRALTEAYVDNYIQTFEPSCIWGYSQISHFERFELLTGLNYKFANVVLRATGLDAFLRGKPEYGQFERQIEEHSEAMAVFRECYAELAATLDASLDLHAAWHIRNRQVASSIQQINRTGMLSPKREGKTFSDILLNAAEAMRVTKKSIGYKGSEAFEVAQTQINRSEFCNLKSKEDTRSAEESIQKADGVDMPPFFLTHNFLVVAGGAVAAMLTFTLMLSFESFTLPVKVIISLAVGLIGSAFIYWFHPDFYYRRMAAFGLAFGAIGGINYTLKLSGVEQFGDSQLKLSNATSGTLVIGGLLFALVCIILDYKYRTNSKSSNF